MTRIGIFGGTFDPTHLGHLEAADLARRALKLDEVRFMPAGSPPHRQAAPHASASHRLLMVKLAVAGREGFRASDDDLNVTGPSYTWDTLSRLHAQRLAPTELFFVLGADAFGEIATWHRYPEVLDAAHFVVIARPGTPLSQVQAQMPELGPRLIDGASFEHARHDTPRIVLVPGATPDVSSTEIRRRVAGGQSVEGLVPPSVIDYIDRHGLYR